MSRADRQRTRAWLLQDSAEVSAPEDPATSGHGHPWWRVLCLTGVDYFSSIGYQPAIAFLAAGAASPLATLVLVAVTLGGALPVYRRVAAESPHGEGSIAMLERGLSWWWGKLLVLTLLGFAATDFIITMTLSAADASQHLIENSYAPHGLHGHQLLVTLVLLAMLSAVFLRGFREAIGIAVALVAAYLLLNAVVVVVALVHTGTHIARIDDWWHALRSQRPSVLSVIGICAIGFPKLALGLSGFETGVVVMPQIDGGDGTEDERDAHRIAGARKLLLTAALIMATLLVASSFVTTVLIPPRAFHPGGDANGRAMAYLAHSLLGAGFGSVYDLSTIAILWFAGASAMAGLLNLVPRFLPRYGMAPAWTLATRPLVLVFTAIAFGITAAYGANVDKQAGAYATGVLVLITSAAVAVAITAHQRGQRRGTATFAIVAGVFLYTTIVNVVQRPEGIIIGGGFILAIVIVSLASRATRAYELRAHTVQWDSVATGFVEQCTADGRLLIIANEPDARDAAEYQEKLARAGQAHALPADARVMFLEITIGDASEFAAHLNVRGEDRFGYRILTVESAAVANAIAAVALSMRDRAGLVPHVYFDWGEAHPLRNQLRFLFLGVGEIAPVTREVLRRAERDTGCRPVIHVA